MAKQLSSFQPQLKSLLDGLVAYWKLDESSGNASDSSGNGYTLTNNSSVAFASGKINNGADFGTSGTTKSFTSTNTALFQGSGDFTFNTWIKINQQPSNTQQNLISIRATSSGGKRHFDYDYRDVGGTKEWNLWTGSTGGTFSSYFNTETLGIWKMITVTYTSADGNLRGYIDNVLRNTTGTSTGDPAGNKFTVGNQDGDNRQVFGMQDECGFWNRVLSPLELQALYNAGNAMAHPLGSTPNSTKLYMPLNGNSVDISGNGNHGTDTAITYVQGKFGQGARFNGSTSKVAIASDLGITGGTITQSAWIKPSQYPSSDADPSSPNRFSIVFQEDGNNGVMNNIYIHNLSGTQIVCNSRWRQSVAIAIAQANYVCPLDGWTHVLGTYDGTNILLYINGILKASTTQTGTGSATSDKSGIGYDGITSSFFNGIIDEVIIESRAWSPQEISTYYRKSMLNYRTKSLFNLIKDFIMTGDTAVFTLTGYDATLSLIQRLIADTGTFIMTGYDAITRATGWQNQNKNNNTWNNQNKNNNTWNNQNKN